jgi:drug/metabolite transporter (DMT)-like permease
MGGGLMYYALILLSVVMFGGGFALQDIYRQKRGSGLRISMESACIGAIAGLVVLLIINGFVLEFTWFTLLMAILAALNGMAFTFCTFKALDYINLSLFSLFAMLGGMMLPFLQGIVFYDEKITFAKVICVIFIIAALICTVDKSERKKGTLFYAGIFIFNGMAGVISKLFTGSKFEKTSAAGYSIWIALLTVIMSGVLWLVLAKSEKHNSPPSKNDEISCEDRKNVLQSYGLGAVYGAINKIANFLLILALMHVDASIQYPMVTGGTMIISTLLSCFGDKKPSKKEIISVGLAFVGMLSLFLIPV